MEQQTLGGKLLFDIFLDNSWIGMSCGFTPKEARDLVKGDFKLLSSRPGLILAPYYGAGTSNDTYEALTGRKARR
jgi:hypothetical protein